MKILRIPGQAALVLLQQLGRLAMFTGQAVFWAMRPPYYGCLLYTSPSPRDLSTSRMPSSA